MHGQSAHPPNRLPMRKQTYLENTMRFFLQTAVDISVNCYEAFIFFMIMRFCVGYEKKLAPFARIGWVVIAFIAVMSSCVLRLHSIITYLLLTAAELAYAHYFFDHAVNMRYFFGFSGLFLTAASRTLTTLIMAYTAPGSLIRSTPAEYLGSVCLYVFLLTLLFFVTIWVKPRDVIITTKLKALMLGIIALSLTNVALLLVFLSENAAALTNVFPIILSCIIILAVAFMAVLISYKLAIANRKYVDEQLLLKQHENELKHYEQMGVIFDTMRSDKHDYNLHLRTILGMSAHNDSKEISEYIQALLNEAPTITQRVNTGNVSLDALISERMITAEANGILFTTKLFVPQELPVPIIDFCSILGNLLDNAIEACMRIDDGRYIKLSVTPKSSMLHISVINSSNGSYKKIDDTFITTKSDKSEHGLGLSRINELTRKYNGASHFKPDTDKFSADIFLPLKED